jgi:hypothetical protein
VQIARGKTFEECVEVLRELEDGRSKLENRR